MAIGEVFKIVWGDSLENTLVPGWPLFGASAYGDPREGSEWAMSPGGEEDAWIVGTDEYLEGDVRFIPISDGSGVSGWDGVAGWRAFLAWARGKKVFRFFPNKDAGSYVEAVLVEPLRGSPGTEDDGLKAIRLKIRAVSGSFVGY